MSAKEKFNGIESLDHPVIAVHVHPAEACGALLVFADAGGC